MVDNAAIYYKLGWDHYKGTDGVALDYEKALKYFEKAAEYGSSGAMNELGLMYIRGDGVRQNCKVAADWFSKAVQADSNNSLAAYNLGELYLTGRGVEKNYIKAYSFFKISADLERGRNDRRYAGSCHALGGILLSYYKNNKEAYKYFAEAAKYGDIVEAWYNLGWLITNGNIMSGDKNTRDEKGMEFYHKAAEHGYIPAMHAIGLLYTEHNMLDEAKPWLSKAANAGYEPAKKYLKKLNALQSGSILVLFT